MRFLALLLFTLPLTATPHPLPGLPTLDEIALPEDLRPSRVAFIKLALESARIHKLNRYIYGSHDPARGGFDCSGAVFYLLKEVGINPARSSSAQYDWIEKAGNLTKIPASTDSLGDPVFDDLKPGDLLFWGGTYIPTDGRTNGVTHVQIYLGREDDDRHVMIGATDGRTYRGTKRCGFGTFDFRLPSKTSKTKFLAFGTPPGLVTE